MSLKHNINMDNTIDWPIKSKYIVFFNFVVYSIFKINKYIVKGSSIYWLSHYIKVNLKITLEYKPDCLVNSLNYCMVKHHCSRYINNGLSSSKFISNIWTCFVVVPSMALPFHGDGLIIVITYLKQIAQDRKSVV